MALSGVGIIAGIFAVFALMKLITIVFNKKVWYNAVVKPVYSNQKASSIGFFIIALIIFYYLIQELSIVQIFAVIGFSGILIGLGLLQFHSDLINFIKRAYDRKMGAAQWAYILIWLAISLWVLYEIFA